MAEAGLTVFNDANVIQIDSTYFNYTLRQKIVGTVVDELIGGRYSVKTLTITHNVAGPSIVAIQMPEGREIGLISCIAGSGGVTMKYAIYHFPDPVGMQLTVYVFGAPVHTGNFGLQVFNAQGQLVFSSESGYMKVLANWLSPSQGAGGVGTTGPFYMYKDVPNAALVISRWAGDYDVRFYRNDYWFEENTNILTYKKTGTRIDTNSLQIYKYGYSTTSGPSFHDNLWENAAMILDVTGM